MVVTEGTSMNASLWTMQWEVKVDSVRANLLKASSPEKVTIGMRPLALACTNLVLEHRSVLRLGEPAQDALKIVCVLVGLTGCSELEQVRISAAI